MRAALAVLALLAAPALAAPGLPILDVPSAPLLPVLAERAVSAPPVVLLSSPRDGEGVAGLLEVAGAAADNDSRVEDVQLRVDGGVWTSVEAALRDAPGVVPWRHVLDTSALAPGEHLVEVRAFDGNAWSLPAAARVKTAAENAPPTVVLLGPRDGDGLAPREPIRLSGLATDADGSVARVEVRVGGGNWTPAGLDGSVWSATLPAPGPGTHAVEARAVDDAGETSLSALARVAAGAQARPPRVEFTSPAPRAGFTSAGSPGCAGCILLSGVVDAPARAVLVRVDGGPERAAATSRLPGLDGGAAWSFAWESRRAFDGPHRFEVRAVGAAGDAGAARTLEVAVASERTFDVLVEPSVVRTAQPFEARVSSAERIVAAAWSVAGARAGDGLAAVINVSRPGVHDVEARVVDADGHVGWGRALVQVLNRPPSAFLALPPLPPLAGEPVVVDASGTTDPDGRVVAWRFDFGDGVVSPWLPEPRVEHAWPRKGDYLVRVSARDDLGAVGDAAARLRVPNSAPLVEASVSDRAPSSLAPVRFGVYAKDADGDAVAFSWDFGDGESASGASVEHRYLRRGAHVVRVVADDHDGGVAVDELLVDVRNLAPTPLFNMTPHDPLAGEVVRFRDETIKPDGRIVRWTWEFGDGNVSDQRDPYHAWAKDGNYVVRLTVIDDWGVMAAVEQVVNVGNSIPDVDIVWTPRNPTVADVVELRALVGDADGDDVVVRWTFEDGSTASGRDVVRRFGAKGPHNVTVEVRDADGALARLTRTVRVVNAAPEIVVEGPLFAVAGVPAELRASVADPDGRVVEVRWDADGDGTDDLTAEHGPWFHAYNGSGRYEAVVTAVDDDGAVARETLEVLVAATGAPDPRPVAAVDVPRRGQALGEVALFHGTAMDDREVRRVEWRILQRGFPVLPDDGTWLEADGAERWSAFLDTRELGNGAFELAVRAVDAGGAGNVTVVPFVAENVPAASRTIALQVLAPASGERASGVVTAQGTAWHARGVTKVLVALDRGDFREAEGTSSWSLPVDTRNITDGLHELRLRAYRGDALYREERVPFRVANLPPDVYVRPENLRGPLRGDVEVQGHTTLDPAAVAVLVRVDGGPPQEADGVRRWSWILETAAYADGEHNLTVTAVGADGLESAPRTVRVVFRNFAPEPARAAPPAAPNESPGLAPLGALLAGVASALAARRRP